jgi:tetratricopeptide (TPR) repeat protein
MKNLLIICSLLISSTIFGQESRPGILFLDTTNKESVLEQGVKFYTDIIEQDPLDAKSLLNRAELYAAMNMTTEAEADTRLALAINPYSYLHKGKRDRQDFFVNRNYEYRVSNHIGDNDGFKKSYLLEEEYISLFDDEFMPSEVRVLLEGALYDIAIGQFLGAEHNLDRVPDQYRDNALYLDLKGVVFLEFGEVERAIEFFDMAIEKDSEFTIAYHNRAVANKLIGNLDAAHDDFESALNQRADIAKIKFSKAKLLELKGDNEGAKSYYQNAMDDDKDYPEARLNYSVMLKAAGEYTMALLEINDLIKEYPEESEHYYVRGGLYFIYGEYLRAAEDFEMYLTSNPDDADVIFYRGLSHLMAGNEVKGCSDISDSLDSGHTEHAALYLFMCE